MSCTPQEGSKTKKTNLDITDSTPPIAVLNNVSPVVNLSNPTLNISVTSNTPDDVVSYKYKIGNSTLDCSLSTGYSEEIGISTPVTANFSNFSSHTIVNNTKICAVGIDISKNQQSFSKATTLSWITDIVAPVATTGNAPSGTSPATLLNISVSAVIPSDIKKYKYKIGLASTNVCSNSTGYSNDRELSVNIIDNISTIADGTIRVCVVGIDGVGNQQSYSTATAVLWNKDTMSPLITFSGSPVGSNTTSALNIIVGSSVPGELVSYRFKVGLDSSTDCTSSDNYSADTNLSIPITNNISLLPNGPIELCAIGTDIYGNQQPLALASAVTWTKDTEASPAVLTGAPVGSSSQVNLNITVSAAVPADILFYKYKLGAASGTDCSVASGYSAAISAITPITNNISAFGDVLMRLCVIAIDNLSNEQSITFATITTWTKDLSPPVAVLNNVPVVLNSITGSSLNIAFDSATPGELFSYRYKYGDASLDCNSPLLYSSDTLITVFPEITDDLFSLSTNALVSNTKICVLAKDAQGNEQSLAAATSASWITDTSIPVASISGAPTGNTPSAVLNISISAVVAADIKNYLYKIVTSPGSCSLATGYSALRLPTLPITDDLATYANGLNVLCVIAVDTAGNTQSYVSATKSSWTKVTTCNNAAASFGGGIGVITDPYLVTNLAQLNSVRTNLNCSYKLMANIDLTAQSFAPLGNSTIPFSGNFDGNEFSISNWIHLSPGTNYIGFFGNVQNVTMPVIIKDLSILNTNISGNYYAGALIGYAGGNAVVIRSKSSGAIYANYNSGGLVGGTAFSTYFSGIYNSSSSATVTSLSNSGGLVGYLELNSSAAGIVNSYAIGNVHSDDYNSGGLVGNYFSYESDFGIRNSYSSGAVVASYENAGGLIGYNYGEDGFGAINSFTVSSVTASDATGGVAGFNEFYFYTRPQNVYSNIYWDINSSGQSNCDYNQTFPGCFGVNSLGTESDYFFNDLNPPFRVSGIQNWDNAYVWNFSGSALPTHRAMSGVAPVAGPVNINQPLTSSLGFLLSTMTFDSGYEVLSYIIVTPPSKGTLSTASSDGYLTYTKNDLHDFNYLKDSFTYKVVDSRGLESGIAIVNIEIQPGCDPDPIIDFTGGSGTAIDPYQITLPEQLINIHKSGYCHYQLLSDIDLDGEIFPPFGSSPYPFNKMFDGNNYKIMNWSYTENVPNQRLGFFRNLSGAIIKNLRLENANIVTISTNSSAGILSGFITNSQIINSSSSGSLSGPSNYNGGLVGTADSSSIFTKTHSTATVSGSNYVGGLIGRGTNTIMSSSYYDGTVTASGSYAAGLVAYFQHSSGVTTTEINNSYSKGSITASGYAGGLVGRLDSYGGINSTYTIRNSYSSASVRDTTASQFAGGFVAELRSGNRSRAITNSFSAGLVTNGRGFLRYSFDSGGPNSPVNNSFWDLYTSNQPLCNHTAVTPLGCNGVNSANSNPNYFFNNTTNGPLPFWDFTTIWRTNSGGYPTLRP